MERRQTHSVTKLALISILVGALACTGLSTAVTASTTTLAGYSQDTQAPAQIESCTTITEPGRYVLTQDIQHDTADPCIRITVSNVILEGRGHTLAGGVDERALTAFMNASFQTGTHPGMPEWDTTGIAANASQPLSNVTVRDLTVTGWFFGIYYSNVSNGEITDTTVTDTGDGISVYDSEGILVAHNEIRTNVGGIVGDGANDTAIRGNQVENNTFTGILFFNTVRNATGFIRFAGPVTNNDIAGNTIAANGGGILVDTGRSNTIRGNTVTGSQFDGIALVFEVTGNTVVNNTVVNNGDNGIIAVINATTNTISNNRVLRNRVNGILLQNNSTQNRVAANQLTANGHSGIALVEDSNANLVASNAITNTTGRDNFTARSGYAAGIVLNGSSDNVIRDTTARNNTNWTYYSLKNATNNTVEELTIDETVTVSFTGTDVAVTRQAESSETETGVARTRVGAGLVLANTSPTASLMNLRVQWQLPAQREREEPDTAAVQALVIEVPGAGQVGPPTDPDDDGLYEDVTGDNRVTVGDVIALGALNVAEQEVGLQLSPEQVAAFDFTGDGQFSWEDVIALASETASRRAS